MTKHCPICSCQLDDKEYKEAVENLKKIISERDDFLKDGAKELD